MYRDEIKNWQGLLIHLLYKSLEFFLISAAIYLAIRCIGIYPVDNDIANCAGKTWWATLCNTVIRLFIIGSGLAYIWYVYCKYEIKGEIAKNNIVLITACGVLLIYWWENPTNICIPLVATATLTLTFYYIQESHLESKKINSSHPKFKSCFGPEIDNSPDRLGRKLLYQRTVDRIRKAYNKKGGNIIGVFGQWGSGKTHLLNYIENELAKDVPEENGLYNQAFKSYNINLWQISERKELWKVFRKTLEKAYHIPNKGSVKQLFAIIIDFLAGINVRGIIEKTIYNEIDLDNDEYNDSLTEQLREKAGHDNILLFLDNVERSNPDIINELLPLIQRLKRLPNLVIILSASLDDIASITGSKTESISQIRGHIFKLVSSIVHIPPPNEHEANLLFTELAEEVQYKKGDNLTYLLKFSLAETLVFDNARQIYRAIEQLEQFESIYFSELASSHTDETIAYSANHVNLAFALELIRTFFPDAFQIMKVFAHIWAKNETLPNLRKFFIYHTPKLSPDQLTKADTIGKFELIEENEKIVDDNYILASIWSAHTNYVTSKLFRSLLYLLQGVKTSDFNYALNMNYASRNQFPPSSCASAALIFANSQETDIDNFIDSKIPAVFRPNLEKTKLDIYTFALSFISSHPKHENRVQYIKTLLSILATKEPITTKYLNEPIRDEYSLSLDEEDYLDIFIYTSKFDNSFAKQGFKSLLSRLPFSVMSRLPLHCSHASKLSLNIEEDTFNREFESRYLSIQEIFASKEYNSAAIILFNEYVHRIFDEILNFDGNVRLLYGTNPQNLYTSYDLTDNEMLHSYLYNSVRDWVNANNDIPAHNLLSYFLRYFSRVSIPHNYSNGSVVNIISYSTVSHHIFKPIRDYISNNIGSISSYNAGFIQSVNEFSKHIQKDIDMLASDHVDTKNKYLAGLHQLKEWVDSFNTTD